MVNDGVLQRALTEVWGFPSFRAHQESSIRAITSGQDSLTILPTGGGKSLCYQLPASLLSGTALVVSPLIALMADQVHALQLLGVPAAFLNSSLTATRSREVRQAFRAGKLKLLYVAPERLVTDSFRDDLAMTKISFVAVDEAHCISQWGHDFRPEYRQLGQIREWLPESAIHAFTATATPRVQTDISRQLCLTDPLIQIGDYFRPNLTFRAEQRRQFKHQLSAAIAPYGNEDSGIVYCLSRKETERWSDWLNQRGRRAAPYHAGLDKNTRSENQHRFAKGEVSIMVATIAFGMGIDQSNVRFVIHNGLPKTLAAYQQESGRAGRDGLPSQCLLFYSLRDYHFWRRIIEEEGALIEPRMAQLTEMLRYATQISCRHARLVQYFGQPFAHSNCGACDVCLGEIESLDDSRDYARKIISAVLRVRESFGAGYVAQVLTGSRERKIEFNGHNRLSVYGLLASHTKGQVQDWVNQLESQSYLDREPGQFPIMKVTERGRQLLRPEKFSLSPSDLPVHLTITRKPKSLQIKHIDPTTYDLDLFETLRQLRRELARDLDVPAFVVFGDRSLQDMAARKPTNQESFEQVFGVGKSKLERFGPAFIQAIKHHLSTEPQRTGEE